MGSCNNSPALQGCVLSNVLWPAIRAQHRHPTGTTRAAPGPHQPEKLQPADLAPLDTPLTYLQAAVGSSKERTLLSLGRGYSRISVGWQAANATASPAANARVWLPCRLRQGVGHGGEVLLGSVPIVALVLVMAQPHNVVCG